MRAAVVTGVGRPLAVEERPDPEPGPGQVVIEVKRCGICGSDLHMVDDVRYGRRPGDIMGHEYAGRVLAVGEDVERVACGDSVAIIPFRSCGACQACQSGDAAWCSSMSLEGGGYAEYALTHERQCILLPRSISLADGALVEPLAVALHAVNVAGPASGQTVLVVGAGPIGLATCWWARHRGASNVVVRDLYPERCERARWLGATDIEVGSGAEPAPASSYDLVFDCAGAPGVLAESIDRVKPRGTIVLLGLCTIPDRFVPFLAIRKEVRILTAVFFRRQEFEEALDALAHVDQLARVMVTSTVTLAELPGKFDALRTGDSAECKVLIAPHGAPEKPLIPTRHAI